VADGLTDVDQRIRRIESLAQTEVGRNIGPLAEAAVGGVLDAARSVAAAPKASVAIMTGAYIPWASPAAAETDGPPGVAILAAGLERLGIPTRLVTDSWCLPVVCAAIRAVAPTLLVDRCDGVADVQGRLLSDYERVGVTHVISVERLGPSADGRVRNFRGEDVTGFTAPLDALVTQGHWTTIAVGDGGNEIGMGNIPETVVGATIADGTLVHCVVPSDHLIVSGVSNWGALALLAAVAVLRGRLLADVTEASGPALHHRVVEACVAAGAVDGTLGRPVPSVDGLDPATHEAIIEEMWKIADMGRTE
jgi:hypothetical protein